MAPVLDGPVIATTVRRSGSVAEEVDGMVSVELGDLPLGGTAGVVWGLDSAQLNANLVVLGPGESIASHINDEVDQLIVVQVGAGTVVVDGETHQVKTDSLLLIPRGALREICAERQMSYLSIHVRRDRLSPRAL